MKDQEERRSKINEVYKSLPEKGTYKKVQPTLKKLCDLLHTTMYECNRLEKKLIIDINHFAIKNQQVFEPNGEPLIIRNEYQIEKVSKYAPASNKNRIKKAWNEGGKKSVGEYILWLYDNNKAINNSETTKQLTELVKHNLKTIF